jgi:predicted MPP superfamily phosphohydrolase
MENKKRKFGVIPFLIISIVLVVLCRIAFDDGLAIRTYTVDSPHVEAEHTFVVIADLHSTLYGEGQSELVAEIDAISPEAIFFVGDIGEDRRDFDNTATLLEAIADRYPCYYVPGNHERWVDYTDDIHALFESYGVITLSEENVDLGDGIVLHGIDDPRFYETKDAFTEALYNFPVSGDKFDILLSHRPEFAERYAEAGFDLTLCGHAHGGQVIIPYVINGVLAPNQGFFPKWAGGEYSFGDARVIVSRGLMRNDLPRVFNPPELVVITVK